jgi:hypothetical protein
MQSRLFLVPEKVVSSPTVWLFKKGPPPPPAVVKDTASTKGKEKGMKVGRTQVQVELRILRGLTSQKD